MAKLSLRVRWSNSSKFLFHFQNFHINLNCLFFASLHFYVFETNILAVIQPRNYNFCQPFLSDVCKYCKNITYYSSISLKVQNFSWKVKLPKRSVMMIPNLMLKLPLETWRKMLWMIVNRLVYLMELIRTVFIWFLLPKVHVF